MGKSAIQWTDATWNPLAGCERCSPGCDHCYAATLAATRLAHVPIYEGLAIREPGKPAAFTGKIKLLPERLSDPLRWRKPRMVFVNSMSDLFHPDVPDGYIAWVWWTMAHAHRHVFQVLTKRPQRMAEWVQRYEDRSGDMDHDEPDGMPPMPRGPAAVREVYTSGRARLFADMLDQWGEPPDGAAYPLYDWQEGMRRWPRRPLDNVWLGASIEDDPYSFRARHVAATPAAVHFLSLEPLLGELPRLDLKGIDWVIVGGESGPGARPMDLGWARDLVARCREAGIPVFVKQLGSCWSGRGHRDLKGGAFETFPEDLQVREMPRA